MVFNFPFQQNGSPDLGKGISRDKSELRSPASAQEAAISKFKYKRIFQTWANKIAMLPCEITIALLPASLSTTQQSGHGFSVCFPYYLFFLMLMLGFYASVAGIILWPVFPKMARCFYLIAFLCMLLALTMFFASLLPSHLQDLPWICLTTVLFIVFGLAVYEECDAPGPK